MTDGPLVTNAKLETLLKRANQHIQYLKTRVAALELDVTVLEGEIKRAKKKPAPFNQQPLRDNSQQLRR